LRTQGWQKVLRDGTFYRNAGMAAPPAARRIPVTVKSQALSVTFWELSVICIY